MKAGVKAARFPARAAGLAAAVAAALLLSGCAAGQHAQTTNAYETLDGVGGRVGDTITLGGAAIERPTDDISWAKDSNVPLKIVIVNSGRSDDQLTTITSPSRASSLGSDTKSLWMPTIRAHSSRSRRMTQCSSTSSGSSRKSFCSAT